MTDKKPGTLTKLKHTALRTLGIALHVLPIAAYIGIAGGITAGVGLAMGVGAPGFIIGAVIGTIAGATGGLTTAFFSTAALAKLAERQGQPTSGFGAYAFFHGFVAAPLFPLLSAAATAIVMSATPPGAPPAKAVALKLPETAGFAVTHNAALTAKAAPQPVAALKRTPGMPTP